MIDIELEKSFKLNAQDRYDIISMAMDAADDNGFINSFIYERALYVYAAIMLYPEWKDELSEAAALDLLRTWDLLLEKNLLEKMNTDYPLEISALTDAAEDWYAEYSDWAHSARGILDMVQTFTGNVLNTAAGRLEETAKETGVANIIDIANEWGMNRDSLKEIPKEENEEVPEESLFNE